MASDCLGAERWNVYHECNLVDGSDLRELAAVAGCMGPRPVRTASMHSVHADLRTIALMRLPSPRSCTSTRSRRCL